MGVGAIVLVADPMPGLGELDSVEAVCSKIECCAAAGGCNPVDPKQVTSGAPAVGKEGGVDETGEEQLFSLSVFFLMRNLL